MPTRERELDNWLAEHLLGWEWCRERCYTDEPHRHDPEDPIVIETPGPFSASGNGLLLVVNAMRERGYALKVEHILKGGQGPGNTWFAVVFVPLLGQVRWGWRYSPALPLAVAEAAQAALQWARKREVMGGAGA